MENILTQSEKSEKSQRKVRENMPVCHFGYLKNQQVTQSLFSNVYARKKVRESEKKIEGAIPKKYSDSDCFSRNSLK
jgi:hypothetical protein